MSDFDEWYKDTREITAEAGWKAGAASRQAEIDELQEMYIQQGLIIAKLQKRIDEALKYTSESPLKDVSRKAMLNFLDILKGESK